MTRNYPNRMSLWHCREPVARSVRRVQFLTRTKAAPRGEAPCGKGLTGSRSHTDASTIETIQGASVRILTSRRVRPEVGLAPPSRARGPARLVLDSRK